MDIPGPGALQRLPGPVLASTDESAPGTIGLITLDAKRAGKPSAGNLHAGFDAAGATAAEIADAIVSYLEGRGYVPIREDN